jgi:hypothetical protein
MKLLFELLALIIVGGTIGLIIPSPFSFFVSFVAGGIIGGTWDSIWVKLNAWMKK